MYEKFLLLGLLYSCGSLKSKSRIEIQTKRKELADILYELAKKITKTKIKAKKFYTITIKNNFKKNFDVGLEKNKLPLEILDNEEKIKNFLQGFFEGKSSISIRKKIIKVSGKKEILTQLKYLLDKIDIKANIYKTGKYYSLYIEGKNRCRIFRDKINFISKEKREILEKLINYY